MTPTPKIATVGAGGALATLVTFVAGQLGFDLPDAVTVALATLFVFILGWLKGDADEPGAHAA